MLLIKNGLLINPAFGTEDPQDILVDGAAIRDIGKPGSLDSAAAQEVIDANGKWVVPGLLDIHVHLREPGQEWKETIDSGTRAAILGGFTGVVSIPNTDPINDSAEVTKLILEKAELAAKAKVYPLGAVTKGSKGKELAHLEDLARAGCVGFSDDGYPVPNAAIMRRALEWAKLHDLPILCHQEVQSLTGGASMNESAISLRLGLKGMPTVAEDIHTARDIELAYYTGGRVHVMHIASKRGVMHVRRAKEDGIPVTTEVTPHHLYLNDEHLVTYDTNYKMSPPLRENEDIEEFWAGLNDGTIDCVASDHAPHEKDAKMLEFEDAPMGILGLQTTLPLMVKAVKDGKISRMRMVEVLTTGPAGVLKLPGGSIKKGAAADITIIDPDFEYSLSEDRIASLSKNSPFLNKTMQGIADTVIVDGRVLVKDKKLEPGV